MTATPKPASAEPPRCTALAIVERCTLSQDHEGKCQFAQPPEPQDVRERLARAITKEYFARFRKPQSDIDRSDLYDIILTRLSPPAPQPEYECPLHPGQRQADCSCSVKCSESCSVWATGYCSCGRIKAAPQQESAREWLDNYYSVRGRVNVRADVFSFERVEELVEAYAAHHAQQLGVHLSHCNFGENAGDCKYGEDETCPALTEAWSWFGAGMQRLAAERPARLEAERQLVAAHRREVEEEERADAAEQREAKLRGTLERLVVIFESGKADPLRAEPSVAAMRDLKKVMRAVDEARAALASRPAAAPQCKNCEEAGEYDVASAPLEKESTE